MLSFPRALRTARSTQNKGGTGSVPGGWDTCGALGTTTSQGSGGAGTVSVGWDTCGTLGLRRRVGAGGVLGASATAGDGFGTGGRVRGHSEEGGRSENIVAKKSISTPGSEPNSRKPSYAGMVAPEWLTVLRESSEAGIGTPNKWPRSSRGRLRSVEIDIEAGTAEVLEAITAGFWGTMAETAAEERMGVGACTVLGTTGTFFWKKCSITWVPRWVLWRLRTPPEPYCKSRLHSGHIAWPTFSASFAQRACIASSSTICFKILSRGLVD
ncbi:hypothetical protein B0H12DRAFT_1068340 [Mycena haematopus]|nr:hypothetical protein B0H12DRAFT_1068340 [Mycena haematopus]